MIFPCNHNIGFFKKAVDVLKDWQHICHASGVTGIDKRR